MPWRRPRQRAPITNRKSNDCTVLCKDIGVAEVRLIDVYQRWRYACPVGRPLAGRRCGCAIHRLTAKILLAGQGLKGRREAVLRGCV